MNGFLLELNHGWHADMLMQVRLGFLILTMHLNILRDLPRNAAPQDYV